MAVGSNSESIAINQKLINGTKDSVEDQKDVAQKKFAAYSSVNASLRKDDKQDEAERLQRSAEKGVKKVEALVKALQQAAHDSSFIQKDAKRTVEDVKAQFFQRNKHLATSLQTIQLSARGNVSKESMHEKLATAEDEAGKLRGDQLLALRQGCRDARDPAAQFVHVTENEVNQEARNVKSSVERMAQLVPGKQDLANEFRARVDAANDAAKEQGELLMRRTQDALDKMLSTATDDVYQQHAMLKESFSNLSIQLDEMPSTSTGSVETGTGKNVVQPLNLDAMPMNTPSKKVDQGSSQGPPSDPVNEMYRKMYNPSGSYLPYGMAGGSQGGSQAASQAGSYQSMYASQYAAQGSQNMYASQYANKIHTPQEAMNKTQLDEWRQDEIKSVTKFVPASYATFPLKNIENMYNTRLHELETTSTSAVSAGEVQSAQAQVQPLNLNAKPVNTLPKQVQPLNLDAMPVFTPPKKGEEKAEASRLHHSSEKGVEKAESLVERLYQAAHNFAFIEKAASVPGRKVSNSFSNRRQHVADTIKTLQIDSTGSDSTGSRQAQEEVGKLRTDQLDALRKAYRDAHDPAAQFVRGTQNEVREQARNVNILADRMARLDPAKQDLANRLRARVEAASDAAKEQGELLMMKTEEACDRAQAKAKEEVWQQDLKLKESFGDFLLKLDQTSEIMPQSREDLSKPDSTGSGAFMAPKEGIRDVPAMVQTAAAALALVFVAFALAQLCACPCSPGISDSKEFYRSIELNDVEDPLSTTENSVDRVHPGEVQDVYQSI